MNLKVLFAGTLLALAFSGSVKAESGRANMVATSTGSTASGTVTFEDTPAGLRVTAEIRNAPPGQHGFHIHEFGDCADSGKAAGSHYNPSNNVHGHAVRDGIKKAHAGDLGNIEIGADGTGRLNATIAEVALTQGERSVAGRAVVLHEKADDFGQPVGNAGGRISCGIIGLVEKSK